MRIILEWPFKIIIVKNVCKEYRKVDRGHGLLKNNVKCRLHGKSDCPTRDTLYTVVKGKATAYPCENKWLKVNTQLIQREDGPDNLALK